MKQTFEYFKEESKEYIKIQKLASIQNRLGQIIHDLEFLVNSIKTRDTVLDKIKKQLEIGGKKLKDLPSTAKTWKQYFEEQEAIIGSELYNQYVKAINNTKLTIGEINRKKVYMDAYRILNELGDLLRGEEIQYQIHLFSGGEVIAFTLTLDQLLEHAVTSEYDKLTLKKDSQLINAFNKAGIQGEKWEEKDVLDYSLFASYIRKGVSIAEQGGNPIDIPDYSQGQLVEAFLSKKEQIQGILLKIKEITNNSQKHLGEVQYSSLVQELLKLIKEQTNNRPFWETGDIGNTQIKSNYADIASAETLLRQLINVQNMLKNLPFTFSALKQKLDDQKGRITQAGAKEIKKILSAIGTGFLKSNIDAAVTEEFNTINIADYF